MTEWIPIATMTVSIFMGIFFLARWFKDDLERQLVDVRTEVDDELKEYRHEMKNVKLTQDTQGNRISILETDQRHTATQLTDIKMDTRAINVKLDSLVTKISDVLIAVKQNGTQ